jgi:hypothetical protein
MSPETYNFSGDAITVIGFIGVASTLLIVVTAFRRFFNSSYNVRVTPEQVSTNASTNPETTVF